MAPLNRKKKVVEERGVVPMTIMEHGKLPPQEVDLEQAVIGALLIEASWVAKVSVLVDEDVFYKAQNGIIYKAIVDLYKRRDPIDILTVTEEIKKQGKLEEVGGAYYITTLTDKVTSTANVEYHCLIILEAFFAREVIRKSHELMHKGFDPMNDVLEIIDEARAFFNSLGNTKHAKSKSSKEFAKELSELTKNPKAVIGIATGLLLFDYCTGGYQNSDLIVLAGRPGMGKTVVMLHGIKRCREKKIKAGVYSYEMTGTQLLQRISSMTLSIKNGAIRANKLTDDEKAKMEFFLSEIKDDFLINESNPDLWALLAIMERDVVEFGVRIIFIDYMQLVPAPKDLKSKSRNDYIGVVSFALKTFAKRHNIPIIALSQLSRESEKREKPGHFTDYRLSDLRESGSLEQDADAVIFVDRIPKTKKARLQIEKFRHGQLREISLVWNGDYVRFEDNLEDKATKMAYAHYEQFGEISIEFEEELKETNKELVDKIVQDSKPADASPIADDFNPLWADDNPYSTKSDPPF